MAARFNYNDEELRVLVTAYEQKQHPTRETLVQLSQKLGYDEKKIRNWFNNRRAKDRKLKGKGTSADRPQATPTTPPIPQSLTDYVRDNSLAESTDVNLKENSYDGVDDQLQSVVYQNPELHHYFQGAILPILSGTQYDAIADIGQGCNGRVILAKHITTKEKVVVKIPLDVEENPDYMEEMLNEFMHQDRAYKVLKGAACTAPKPLGFIRMKSDSVALGYIYLSVLEFVPVLPNALCTLTMFQATLEHEEERPVIDKEGWRTLIQDLIDATDLLQRNDIAHNDIKEDNVMVRFGRDSRPKAVLIDYGLSTKLSSIPTTGGAYLAATPGKDIHDSHNAPELFLQPNALPTSDLYSVAKLIKSIGISTKVKELETVGIQYCKMPMHYRKGHQALRQDVIIAFGGEIPVCDPLQQNRLQPPMVAPSNIFEVILNNGNIVQPIVAAPGPVVAPNPLAVQPAFALPPMAPQQRVAQPICAQPPMVPNQRVAQPMYAQPPMAPQQRVAQPIYAQPPMAPHPMAAQPQYFM